MSKTRPKIQAKSVVNPWPMVRLGDVCEFSRGLTYSKSDEVQFSLNVVLRSNNVDLETGRLVLDELKYIRDSIEIPTSKRVAKGAILMCTANGSKQHLGKVALIDGDYNYAFGGFMGLLTPNASIDSRYLYWQLMSFEFKRFVTTLTDGANINNLKFADISQFTFLLPPLPVQREIVARLERELAAVEKMKKGFEALAETAKQEFKAELNEVFEEISRGGTETRRLGDVLDTGAGGTPLKQHRDYYDGGDIPWLRSGEVCKKGITETELFITAKGLANSSAKLFPKDSVVVAMYGATAGQVGILRIESTTNQAVCAIIPSSKHIPEFLYYQLLGMKEEMVSQAQGGAQPNISQIKIKNLRVCLPPLADQRKVVARLDLVKARAEKLEAKAREGVVVCETMRKAILKEAFE